MPADDASSLRAAALLTLKSKRRKVPAEPAPPLNVRPPPPADDTLQLDYGQEETPSNPTPSNALPSDTPSALSTSQEAHTEVTSTNDFEEGQIREEGEISDEDDAPATPAKPTQSTEYFRPKPDTHLSAAKPSPPQPSPPLAASPRLPALLERITDPPQYMPIGEDESVPSEDVAMQEYSPMDHTPLLVDHNHVRPGIPLKQEEYNIAKDIILDLLGWGVPPEYLVDCGLTRQIVYYVFAELNLELPQNLDTSDLIPFTPEVATSVLTRQKPAVCEVPPSGQSLLTRLNLGSNIPRPATPPPPNIEEVRSPGQNELLDIERQRRQELLARKAVLASRKAKQAAQSAEETSSVASSAGISPSEPPGNQDMETTPVASEAVDDFLKSIATPVEQHSKPTLTPPPANGNNMDLDEIPGLGSLSRSSSSQIDATVATPSERVVVSPSGSVPPRSTDTSDTAFSSTAQDTTTPANSFLAQRRGNKRPVASDFVDLDPSHRIGPNGNRLPDVPSRPGTGVNFSSVAMKRCVIDLSDSESEELFSSVPMKRARSKGYASPRMRNETPGSGWNTPSLVSTATVSATSSGHSALELKIKQMKEEIARREQEMKRASALRPASAAGNTSAVSGGASVSTAVVVKQEEDDSLPSTAMQTDEVDINIQRSRTHTPDVPSTSANPRQERQSLDPSTMPRTTSDNSSINVSASSTPSIADNDADNENSSSISSQPAITNDQVPADDGLDGQAEPVLASGREDRQQEQQWDKPESSQQVDVDQEMSTSAEALQTTSVHQKQDGKLDPAPLSSESKNIFSTYASPFEWYPLLRFHSRSIISGQLTPVEQASYSSSSNSVFAVPVSSASLSPAVFPASSVYPSSHSALSIPTSSNSCSNFPLPNLKPLKLAAAAKLLDPSKRICQYEVPGGGVCRDAGCEDLHLSRVMGPSTGGASGTGGFEPTDQDAAEYLFNTLPADWLSQHGISSSKILTALEQVRFKNMPIAFEDRVAQALCALGPPPLPPPPT